MRFTSNALIVSIVALLSLITSVVNADSEVPAKITSPSAGQILRPSQLVDVKWYVVEGESERSGAIIGH